MKQVTFTIISMVPIFILVGNNSEVFKMVDWSIKATLLVTLIQSIYPIFLRLFHSLMKMARLFQRVRTRIAIKVAGMTTYMTLRLF